MQTYTKIINTSEPLFMQLIKRVYGDTAISGRVEFWVTRELDSVLIKIIED